MKNNNMQLHTLVCGSTQGIGLAIAQQLANDGFSVVLTARNEARLQNALATLDISKGQVHQYFVSDFTDPAGLKIAIDNFIKLKNFTTFKEKGICLAVKNT
jgi:3-oxoacyl-[acyl-carrier protein] reductase